MLQVHLHVQSVSVRKSALCAYNHPRTDQKEVILDQVVSELLLRQRPISHAIDKLVFGISSPRPFHILAFEKVVYEATSPVC